MLKAEMVMITAELVPEVAMTDAVYGHGLMIADVKIVIQKLVCQI